MHNEEMAGQQLVYRKVELPADQDAKLKAIGILMKSGQTFTALSNQEYLVSLQQCKSLTDAGIKYKKLNGVKKENQTSLQIT